MAETTVGLLNIMPSAVYQQTTEQWSALLGDSVGVQLLRFDKETRTGSHIESAVPALEALDNGLDGLIITGANLERDSSGNLLAYDAVAYAEQLAEVIAVAERSTRLNIYSCFAAQFALSQLFSLPRVLGSEKTHGVFCHDIPEPSSPLVQGIEMPFRAPHSRWASVPTELLERAGVTVVAASFEADWLLATSERPKGLSVFIQGHPEYGQFDLREEFRRDRSADPQIPYGYFPNNDTDNIPPHSWQANAKTLFGNIVAILQPSELSSR